MVVKNLKVINNDKLNTDGTFEIGLRDALLISKNSKVTLDKFVYRQGTSSIDKYKKSKIPIKITMTADVSGTLGISDPSTPISFTLNDLSTVNDFLKKLDIQIARHLNGGNPNGNIWQDYKYWLGQYDEDNLGKKTSRDVGLDVWSNIDNTTNNININVISYKSTVVATQDENCKIQNVELEDDNSFVAGDNDNQLWYVAGSFPIVKSAFQMYFEIDSIWSDPEDAYRPFEIGVRDFSKTDYTSSIGEVYDDEDGVITPACISWGIRVTDTEYYLINMNLQEALPLDVAVQGGQKIMIYSGGSNGKNLEGFDYMTIFIFNSLDQILYKNTFAYPSGTGNTKGIFLGEHFIQYRLWAGDVVGIEGADLSAKGLQIKDFQGTVSNIEVLGLAREFQLDFSECGSLANELGFTSSIVNGGYTSFGLIVGQQSPSFYAIQDISIYWSLPMLSFIASADKKRNAREKLISTFSPSRSVDRYDSLIYNSSLPYVSIGNNEQMNISALSFRVINEYTGEALNSAYLSFNLLIKDEDD